MPADASGPAPVRSVYVHAPFCARRCVYCDFAVHVRRTGDLEGWLEALAGELSAVADEGLFRLDDELDTLYVGGGTPSLLGPDAMVGLAGLLGEGRLAGSRLEWTAEANPESFTAEVGEAWREVGVNRLSLGVQSFHEPALKWMGRLHGPQGARDAVARARAAGIENISVDLIFGLPAHLGRSWKADLEETLRLAPPHVSLYGLTVEGGTRLGRAVAEGLEPPVDDERYREEFLQAAEVLTSQGYEHYEVSNFARPGRASRHNTVYWTGDPYLGLGNGAHSYAHPVRRWNLRGWEAYRARAASGELPEEARERVEGDALRLERLWLGLRTREGVAVGSLGPAGLRQVDAWVRRGLAEVEEEAVRLTAEGWLLLDRLTVELEEALEG